MDRRINEIVHWLAYGSSPLLDEMVMLRVLVGWITETA